MITIFKNIKETSAPFYRDVSFVFDRIREGKYKDLINSIRKEKDKTQRNELKKQLPAVCFSGQFRKRADDAIIEHSGLICLDFDGYKTRKEMLEHKATMVADKFVMSVFISPSGNGLKTIVKIPADKDNHKEYFNALMLHFNSDYFDTTSKNVSRVCYESYDADIHVNMDSVLWDVLPEKEYKEVIDFSKAIPIKDENKIVDILMKWWTREFGLVDGERNNNVFILAAAFNEFGVHKSLAEHIIGNMQSKDFPLSEIKVTINSAYRNTAVHGTKFYEDETMLHKIRVQVNKGASSSEIKKDLRDVDISSEVIDNVVKALEKDSALEKFWHKTDKGAISIVHYLFKEFLEQNGFYKFAPHGSDKYMFVRVTNNLIDKASEEEIKDFTLSYLQSIDDYTIYNFFADKTRFFKEDFLSMLDTVNIHFVKDTREFSFIYFRNCALKVTKTEVESMDYIDLDGYVWRDQVIDRDFEFCDETKCDFRKFIENIGDNQEDRIKSLRSTIGFLMSGYKDPGFCPSVILNDEVVTEDPEGGTGKGLFVQAISMMKKVASIDGKKFSFDSQFAFQTVTTDTQVVCFDDAMKNFNFERLFSVITEGITIEKKNKDAIKIPFSFSPKIVITTNYMIRGRGNSFARRKWELEFKQRYNIKFTPVDEFGKRFFDEWDEDEWCAFDNYMISNLQFYLNEGLVKSKFNNLGIKDLATETCHEFVEWLGLIDGSSATDLIVYDKKIFKNDLYQEFIQDNPDFAPRAKMTISLSAFYKWLRYFANYKEGVTAVEGRDSNGRWIIFKTDDSKERENTVLEF